MTLPALAWPELLLALAGLLLVLNAARRGFLREGSLLLSLALALWLAGRLYPALNAVALGGASAGPWSVGLFAGLLITLLLTCLALSALLVPLVRHGPLGLVDRLGGLAIGVVEAALILGLLANTADRLGLYHPPPESPAGRAAVLAARGVALLGAALPVEIAPLAAPADRDSALPPAARPR